MDAITIKNYFISKGFLLVNVKESYEIKNEIADINFNIDEGKQFFVSKVTIAGNKNLSGTQIKSILNLWEGEPLSLIHI